MPLTNFLLNKNWLNRGKSNIFRKFGNFLIEDTNIALVLTIFSHSASNLSLRFFIIKCISVFITELCPKTFLPQKSKETFMMNLFGRLKFLPSKEKAIEGKIPKQKKSPV